MDQGAFQLRFLNDSAGLEKYSQSLFFCMVSCFERLESRQEEGKGATFNCREAHALYNLRSDFLKENPETKKTIEQGPFHPEIMLTWKLLEALKTEVFIELSREEATALLATCKHIRKPRMQASQVLATADEIKALKTAHKEENSHPRPRERIYFRVIWPNDIYYFPDAIRHNRAPSLMAKTRGCQSFFKALDERVDQASALSLNREQLLNAVAACVSLQLMEPDFFTKTRYPHATLLHKLFTKLSIASDESTAFKTNKAVVLNSAEATYLINLFWTWPRYKLEPAPGTVFDPFDSFAVYEIVPSS